MKPIKPKPMSKALKARLRDLHEHPRASFGARTSLLTARDARAILAALEHERQLGRREGAATQMDRMLEGPP